MSEDIAPGANYYKPDEHALSAFGQDRINELYGNEATAEDAQALVDVVGSAVQEDSFTTSKKFPSIDGKGTHTRLTSTLRSFKEGDAGEGLRISKYDGPVKGGLLGDRATVVVNDPRPALEIDPKEALYVDRETGLPWIARSVPAEEGASTVVGYKLATKQELEHWLTGVVDGIRQRDMFKAMGQGETVDISEFTTK